MTADENNPVIYVDYSSDGSNWQSLVPNLSEFTVKNSGLMKTPEATLTLKNTGGKYSGQGAFSILNAKFLKIRADVRGTIDPLFWGYTTRRHLYSKQKQELLDVTARGFTQTLLRDYVSKKYATEQKEGVTTRTLKDCIDNMLQYPDSANDTLIRLTTDSGAISTIEAKHDFDRDFLLDSINKIGEYAGYAGYADPTFGQAKIYLYPYGWQATNPAITIPPTVAVLNREYEESIDELFNHIIVWATVYTQYPYNDFTTEGGVAKGYWTPLNANCVVADDSNVKKVNAKSVRVTKNSGYTVKIGAVCTLSLNESVNTTARKLVFFNFALKSSYGSEFVQVTLEDTNGKKIWRTANFVVDQRKYADGFTFYSMELGSVYRLYNYSNWHIREIGDADPLPKGTWFTTAAAGTGFNWIIKKITIESLANLPTAQYTWYIDGMYFSTGEMVNPLEDVTLQAIDQPSINTHGRSVLYYDAPEMHYRDLIKEYADRLLAGTKNPMKKLKVTYGAKTWVKPNEYVTVNLPVYGISNEQWRIVELEYEWSTKTKLLRSKLSLTPRTQPVLGREWYRSQLEGLLLNMSW